MNIRPCSPLILPKAGCGGRFQTHAVFFQVDAAQVRIGQANVFAEFFVGFFAAADAGFLFGNRYGIPFFQVVQVFLQQDVAATGIGSAFGDNGDIADVFQSPCGFSVPSTKPSSPRSSYRRRPCSSVAMLMLSPNAAKTDWASAKAAFLAVGLDVDVNIVLGRRGKAVAHDGKRLDFAAFFRVSERFPCVAAEGDGHA